MLHTNSQFQTAQELFKNGQYKKSFLNLIKISTEFSNEPEFLRLLSQVQMSLKDFTGQLKTLQVLSRKSTDIEDKVKYMMALLSQGQRNESLDEALKLLTMPLTKTEKVFVFKALIRIYSVENDFEGLEDVCRELGTLGINDAEVSYSHALVEAAKGELDQAIEHLRQAVVDNPLFDTGWAALGLYHYKKGDIELAKANLEKALDINPANTTALKHISNWVDDSQPDELNATLEKVNYYLQKFNFDEEISGCHANLLIKKGQAELAQLEIDKLTYYFGN
ncbi:tetratricopeptide repeat protein [Pseudobdellovibrio sp. HCB154]|uniref:tetratricopeptide repeat protein n=1 Tax=Pseudobdellovibrio sp. HCB154 TaxID=3386277 RepID=UPI0039174D25